jgi:hypothetical protein
MPGTKLIGQKKNSQLVHIDSTTIAGLKINIKNMIAKIINMGALSWNVFRTIAFLIFPMTMKVFDIQDVDAHSCMVRKQLFLNIEVLTMTFRGLQC